MEGTGKTIIWGTIGVELIGVLYDLRYMIICSIALILADLWWGYSESRKRLEEAKEAGDTTLIDKYKWHKSRAGRRTTMKFVDYVTFLIVGALIGLAITEPMEICSHVWTAAIGLGIGCACEVASIVGHVAYVKLDVELSIAETWKILVRFLGRLIKSKSEQIGDAVEELGREGGQHHHHQDRYLHESPDPAEIEPYNEEL